MGENGRIGDQLGLWDTQAEKRTVPRRDRRPAGPGERPARLPTQRPSAPMAFRELWGIDDVAKYLGVPKQTIYSWRQSGYGPKAIRVGKHLRWRHSVVIERSQAQEREG